MPALPLSSSAAERLARLPALQEVNLAGDYSLYGKPVEDRLDVMQELLRVRQAHLRIWWIIDDSVQSTIME